MLSVTDVLTLMAEGKQLPQEQFPPLTDHQIADVQNFEPGLVNQVLGAGEEDPVDIIMADVRKKAQEHGWYPVAGLLCMLFSQRYHEDSVPELPTVSPETMGLLKMLPIAGRAMDEDEGAWTIPLAMLASLGEEEALEFTACATLCAAVGVIESGLTEGAQG